MTVTLMPDVERILSRYLRDRAELAALVDDRVYTSVPDKATFPLVRLVRIGGAPLMPHPLWVDNPLIQVDAWGGPKAMAWLVAETARALLDAMPETDSGVFDGGVISHTSFGEFRYEPDVEFTPARPRYLFTMEVTCHPTTVGVSS